MVATRRDLWDLEQARSWWKLKNAENFLSLKLASYHTRTLGLLNHYQFFILIYIPLHNKIKLQYSKFSAFIQINFRTIFNSKFYFIIFFAFLSLAFLTRHQFHFNYISTKKKIHINYKKRNALEAAQTQTLRDPYIALSWLSQGTLFNDSTKSAVEGRSTIRRRGGTAGGAGGHRGWRGAVT